MIDKIKKMETSKKVTWSILILYFISFIAATVLLAFGINILQAFEYLHFLAVIVVTGYFGKSGYENKFKIKSSSEDSYEGEYEEEEDYIAG